MKDRIPYKDACQRSRLSSDRLLASELKTQARALKLWIACNQLTAGWSKSADRVHVSTLADMAGIEAKRASALLRKFDELGIFIWRKDRHSHSKGFLALPSWVEPEQMADGQVQTSATPSSSENACAQCGAPALPSMYLCQTHYREWSGQEA